MSRISSQNLWFLLNGLRDVYYKCLRDEPEKWCGVLKDYIPAPALDFLKVILIEIGELRDENVNLSRIIFERGDELDKKRILELEQALKISKKTSLDAFKAGERVSDEYYEIIKKERNARIDAELKLQAEIAKGAECQN